MRIYWCHPNISLSKRYTLKFKQDEQNKEEYKPINICTSMPDHSNVTVGLPGVIPFRVSFQFLLSLAGASATSTI